MPPPDLGHRARVEEVDDLRDVRQLEPGRLGVAVDGDDARAELLHARERAPLVASRADEEERPPDLTAGDRYVRAVRRVLVTGMSGTRQVDGAPRRAGKPRLPRRRHGRAGLEGAARRRRGLARGPHGALLAEDDGRTPVVSGCVPNQGAFYDRFDAVVLLSAPADVILDRIATRTTNGFGKSPEERARVLADLAETEPLLRATCTDEIDASRPLDEVVEALVALGRGLISRRRPGRGTPPGPTARSGSRRRARSRRATRRPWNTPVTIASAGPP